MRPILSVLLLLVALPCLAADPPLQDYQTPLGPGAHLVGLDCDTAAGTLEIASFDPSSPPARPMDLWKTSDMVTVDRELWQVTDMRPLERTCSTGGDEFRVRFEPVPGNVYVNSLCGALTFARATVWKNGRVVFDEQFETCNAEVVIRSVRFERGVDAPHILRERTP